MIFGGFIMSEFEDAQSGIRRIADRRSLLRGVAGLSMLPLAGGLSGCDDTAADASPPPAPTPTPSATTSFAIAVLPDTQFYARYATADENNQFQRKYGSEPYAAQTQWIVDNAKTYAIPFVIHLGDVVDQVRKPAQWTVADAAMKRLETAKIPYSILAGNHDVLSDLDYHTPADQQYGTDSQRTLSAEPYLTWFPTSRAQAQATFRERDRTGFHEYHIVEMYGVKFMVLSLSWRISDSAILWARDVIRRNPTLPVILSNHQLLNIDKDGKSPLETDYGLMLWNTLIRDNDQIFMTLNGHHHGAALLTKTNDYGNPVHEMVVDYQMAYQGGNALMRLYEIDFSANRIDVMSFSPWVVKKPKATLNQFDRALLEDANNRFTIKIDFKARFARFLPNFAYTAAASGTPILPRVRTALLDGYVEPAAPVEVLPRDADDYPKVAETAAHWRVANGITDGAIVRVGDTLGDVTGRNPMARVPLSGPAQDQDVVWSTDRHRLSSAPGSVRFRNTDKATARSSAFATAANAPINAMTFTAGYTVETFIKIDANWTVTNHRWGNILTRNGNRGKLPGFAGGDRESPPILFAISSLREIQWEVVPASNTRYPQANWSGEVMVDTWYHVAIVNDPSTNETILYVDGAPVLRNAAGQVGIAALAADMPWVLGAAWWNGERKDGYFGNIGEVRIVAKPLPAAQWLTARRS